MNVKKDMEKMKGKMGLNMPMKDMPPKGMPMKDKPKGNMKGGKKGC